MVEFPEPQAGKKRARTARERLLSSDLWVAHIERKLMVLIGFKLGGTLFWRRRLWEDNLIFEEGAL
ncbi:hypothetical protein OROHE_005808 [Orobanche hederae]